MTIPLFQGIRVEVGEIPSPDLPLVCLIEHVLAEPDQHADVAGFSQFYLLAAKRHSQGSPPHF